MERSAIFEAIKADHIEQALSYIDEHGVPKGRNSTKYSLRHNG
jgi:hypothetical protein